jgi:hypothetical protein
MLLGYFLIADYKGKMVYFYKLGIALLNRAMPSAAGTQRS